MTVPEALEALNRIKTLSRETFRREAEKILEAVWLQAYEEGESRVFSGSPRLTDERGTDLGEIIETDWQDGHYVVYVKERS